MKKLSCAEFVKKARATHGNRYDYSHSDYVNSTTKLAIICPSHGTFYQTPNHHIRNRNCPKCQREKQGLRQFSSTDAFIVSAKKVHGNLYDYSNVQYVNSVDKIVILCKTHGPFEQIPSNHLQRHGCPKCQLEQHTKSHARVLADFITVHGNKFDYSRVKYISSDRKIDIVCPIHGIFSQEPRNHLRGAGCPNCKVVTTDEFISHAKKIHGDVYDYSAAKYTLTDNKLIIICKKHGQYSQRPNSHLRGSGCPKCGKCRISKSETVFLNHIDIPEEFRQHRIPTTRYQVDGFSPETNTVYEFLGDYWHGNPKLYPSEKFNKNAKSTFGKLHEKTLARFDDISKLGVSIKYIWESDWKNWKKDKTHPMLIKTHTISSI